MKLILFVVGMLFTLTGFAQQEDMAFFNKIFSDWTYAFNHQQLEPTCQLFSKQVIASYQGIPEKNYKTICDGVKKIFALKDDKFEYQYKLHAVYRSDNLASVRLTWYLRHFKNNHLVEKIQDEGLDVLQKNASGQWQIVNYLAYPLIQ